MNVGQLLVNTARRLPDAPAVTWEGKTVTYRELDDRSDRFVHAMADLGVAAGSRVAVFMRNRPELLEVMFACFKGGLAFVPLNAKLTASEVRYHVQDSGAAVVVTDEESVGTVAAAELDASVVVAGELPEAGRMRSYEVMLSTVRERGSACRNIHGDTLAWLFYTSGTTGKPKGAMLSHAALDFVTASWLADLTPMDELDVTLHAAPLTHGAGFHALAATARGAHQLILNGGRFEPASVLEQMASRGVTNTWLVPTQIVMLTDALQQMWQTSARLSLPELRRVVYGGAPFALTDLRRALETFGPVFVQLYGQGETPMTATVLPARDHELAMQGEHAQRLRSAGFARPGMEVRILDDCGTELLPGEVGEVVVRGPAVMNGYWQRPEESASTLRGGWLHTGDLGRMDKHGFLYLLERAKDLIITGGSNVYAVEVEAVLAEHPAVREVAVVGLPDRVWGERVVAVVVTRDHQDHAAELAASCVAKLANYKCPRSFELVDELPRNAYGKVLKRELRALLSKQAMTAETREDAQCR